TEALRQSTPLAAVLGDIKIALHLQVRQTDCCHAVVADNARSVDNWASVISIARVDDQTTLA
ncbi:hypothetical protein, partial [Paraburkholderia nodosa]|uniref:hypothetical protein n=1 Tax=Paraburkholderia nodosa TaxID=392320 RepID=UPI001C40498B